MRLTRLDAVRFGRLEDVSLGEIGAGLTVVLGPNGAGKTSLTTLARYVLYGYPKRSESEPGYESASGKRLGRLVFAEGDGEWVVERTEGTHGGSTQVNTVSGPDRPDLIERVTQGVSRNEFRVVFGFGLQDMADIATGSGGSGVLSRLYAARVGLDVSPQDVRDELEDQAARLFKPRGSTPLVNSANREIKDIKKRIRDLEFAATQYAEERAQLAQMREELERLRERRTATSERRSTLESYAAGLAELEETIEGLESQSRDNELERVRVARELEGISLDEDLLGAGTAIRALVDQVSGYREWLAAIDKLESRGYESERDAREALASVAISEDVARGVMLGADTASGVQRYRDALARAQVRVESATRALDESRARADVATRQQVAGGVRRRSGAIVPALLASLGVLALAAGLATSQWVAAIVGALIVVAGAALLLVGREQPARDADPASFDAATELARSEFDAARRALDDVRKEWLTWARERGLGGVEDPEAASLVVAAVGGWRRALGQRDDLAAEARGYRERCDEMRDSLAGLVGDRLPALGTADRADVPVLAVQARDLLDAQTSLRDRREALSSTAESLVNDAASLEGELEAARESRTELLERVGGSDVDSARLNAMAVAAAEDAAEADAAYVQLYGHVGEASGRLDEEGKDAQMAQLRLELESWRTRLREAIERYAVYASAAALIARTQAFYERARQPEVVRRAGEVFAGITQARYDRISIPAGGGEIVAYRGAEPTPSSELSRGSQEQLYLSLRIALVEQLDGVGDGLPVLMDDIFANFDAERHAGAAKAVAELSRHRQVVFFTCHPEVADLFASVDPGHTRLELGRC